MPAPQAVLDLIERFDRNLEAYRSGHYKEARLRAEFIDPFFKALGWDIYNEQGHAEAYKNAVNKDAVKQYYNRALMQRLLTGKVGVKPNE